MFGVNECGRPAPDTCRILALIDNLLLHELLNLLLGEAQEAAKNGLVVLPKLRARGDDAAGRLAKMDRAAGLLQYIEDRSVVDGHDVVPGA